MSMFRGVARAAKKKGKRPVNTPTKAPRKPRRSAMGGGRKLQAPPTTRPTQRTYGKGKGVGKAIGRRQGVAASAAVGLSVAAIMEIRSKKKLEELKKLNLDANQRAAVNKALRIVAEKEAAKAKMGGVKPKIKPSELKGGGMTKTKMYGGGMSKKKK